MLLLGGGAAMVRGASGIAGGLWRPTASRWPYRRCLRYQCAGTGSPTCLAHWRVRQNWPSVILQAQTLANLGLVLGSAAVITPMTLQGKIIRRELPLLLLGTTVLLFMTLDPLLRGESPIIDRSDGLVMLLLFSIFLLSNRDGFSAGRGKIR